MSLDDVTKAVEEAAEAISTLHTQEWAGWVTYLMKSLDERHPPEEIMRENLETIRSDIEARLRDDRW